MKRDMLKKLDSFGGEIETSLALMRVHAKRFGENAIVVFRTELSNNYASYFLRMLEYYTWEAWGSRHRPINREEFAKWYAITHDGCVYEEKAYGHFIRADMVLEFFRKYLPHGLTREEREMLNVLRGLGCFHVDGRTIRKARGVDTHLIIVNQDLCIGDKIPPHEVLYHELSHMLYFTIPDYARKVRGVWKGMRGEYKRRITRALKTLEYVPSDMPDEWAANVVGERGRMYRQSFRLDDDTRARLAVVKRMFREKMKEVKDFYAEEEKHGGEEIVRAAARRK